MYLLRQDRRTRGTAPAARRSPRPRRRAGPRLRRLPLRAAGGRVPLHGAHAAAPARRPSRWPGARGHDTALRRLVAAERCGGRSPAPGSTSSSTPARRDGLSASLSEAAPETDEDYVRLIYTVAYGLDGASSFRFERAPSAGEDRVASPRRLWVPAGGRGPATARARIAAWNSPSSTRSSRPLSRSGSASRHAAALGARADPGVGAAPGPGLALRRALPRADRRVPAHRRLAARHRPRPPALPCRPRVGRAARPVHKLESLVLCALRLAYHEDMQRSLGRRPLRAHGGRAA